MARYADADLKKKFQKVRAFCDDIWLKKSPEIPEFDLKAIREQGHSLFPVTVWVHSKDGEAHVGDMLLIARLAPVLRQRNIRLLCLSNPSLPPLLSPMRDCFEAVPYTLSKEDIFQRMAFVTHHSNWSNLLRRLSHEIPDISVQKSPYLAVDKGLSEELKADYQIEADKPVVGVVWRTSLIGRNPVRDTHLEDWSSILSDRSANYISLQYGSVEEIQKDITEAGARKGIVLRHDERVDAIGDLPTYAAQVNACDFVMSVDCSTVFLAGGLGIPMVTLIPHENPSFRWENAGSICPFFPSNRLVRQPKANGWKDALAEAKQHFTASTKNWVPALPQTQDRSWYMTWKCG